MIKVITDFSQWPRTRSGDPIFTCSEDAIFYAHLIFEYGNERLKVTRLRRKALFDSKLMISKKDSNLQRVMDLAVKGQFYRECLEEIERLEKELP